MSEPVMIYPVEYCLKGHSVFEIEGVTVMTELVLVKVVAHGLAEKLHFFFICAWSLGITGNMAKISVRPVLDTSIVISVYSLRMIV